MKYLGPTRHARLNEAAAVVYLLAGLFVFFSLASYHPFDPSFNTAASPPKPVNLTGVVGAYFADFFLQALGLGAYAIPALILILGWKNHTSGPPIYSKKYWRASHDEGQLAVDLTIDSESHKTRIEFLAKFENMPKAQVLSYLTPSASELSLASSSIEGLGTASLSETISISCSFVLS